MKDIKETIFIKKRRVIKLEKELDHLNYIIREIHLIFSEESIPSFLDKYENLILKYQTICKKDKILEQKRYNKIQKDINKIREDLTPYIERLKELNALQFTIFRLENWLNSDKYWWLLGFVSFSSIFIVIIILLIIS